MAAKTKILVVDDEEFNLDIITEILSRAGFEVICAEDGDKVMALLEKNQDISLIVMDIIMPRMNGLMVLKNIHDSSFKKLPVILQTIDNSSVNIRTTGHGKVYSLIKPYEDDGLINLVNKALNEDSK